jgi:hypothetical protein
MFQISNHQRSIDRPLLEWVTSIMKADISPHENRLKIEDLNKMLGFSNEEIATLNKRPRAATEGMNLKKIYLPFLSANISSLYLFTPEFQRLALEIHSNLMLINEEIDVARTSTERTFDPSMSTVNYAAARTNIALAFNNIKNQSRWLADVIGLILERKT